MGSRRVLAWLVLAVALSPASVGAQSERTVPRLTTDDVLALLVANGVEGAHPKVKTHRPAIQARLGGQPGMVFLFDCEETRCGSLKFVAFGKAEAKHDLAFLNAWNASRRYVGAYLHDGNVYLSMDYDLRGGVTSGALTQALRSFQVLVGLFRNFNPR